MMLKAESAASFVVALISLKMKYMFPQDGVGGFSTSQFKGMSKCDRAEMS